MCSAVSMNLTTALVAANGEMEKKGQKVDVNEKQYVSLAEALLPKRIIRLLQQGDEVTYRNKDAGFMGAEIALQRLSRFVLKASVLALKELKKQNFVAFDALVGDSACQSRAYLNLVAFSSSETFSEAETIFKTIVAYLATLNQMKVGKKTGLKDYLDFFQLKTSLRITRKMEFLFQAFLLTHTKKLMKDGITEITEISAVDNISERIDVEIRREIIGDLQVRMSFRSIELIYMESAKLPDKEFALTKKMLAPEMTRCYSADPDYPKKSFSFLFYNFKAILLNLKEKRALVCVKKMVKPKEEGFTVLFRSAVAGGALALVSIEEAQKIQNAKAPIIVLEAEVQDGLNQATLGAFLVKEGLEEVLLANASQETQFEPRTGLDIIKNEEALAELNLYQAKAQKLDCQKGKKPIFLLDHVYASSLAIEMPAKKGGKS